MNKLTGLGDLVQELMHVRMDHPEQFGPGTKFEFWLCADEGYTDVDMDAALSNPLEIKDIKPRADGANVICIYLRAWGR